MTYTSYDISDIGDFTTFFRQWLDKVGPTYFPDMFSETGNSWDFDRVYVDTYAALNPWYKPDPDQDVIDVIMQFEFVGG